MRTTCASARARYMAPTAARRAIVLRPDAHLEDLDDLAGHLDPQRVADRVVVGAQPGRRKRMGHVAHLVAVAESDDLGEVVLHDPEMIAMVFDVRRQQQRVATAEDQLLAVVRRAPVDFERDLVRLHDFGRIGESFANLRQKGERSEGGGRVVGQAGVRQLPRATLGRASHQRRRRGHRSILRRAVRPGDCASAIEHPRDGDETRRRDRARTRGTRAREAIEDAMHRAIDHRAYRRSLPLRVDVMTDLTW